MSWYVQVGCGQKWHGMDSNELKQVVVMHHGKNMRRGKMISQACHAAMMIFLQPNPGLAGLIQLTRIQDWYRDWGMKKVCLYVKSDEELLAIAEKAKAAGLDCHVITDSGHTEFHGEPTLTCCAIGPDLSSKIDEVTGHLPLL